MTPRRSCFFSACFAVSAVTVVSAQMTGAPAAGYKLEPGMSASTIPAALTRMAVTNPT